MKKLLKIIGIIAAAFVLLLLLCPLWLGPVAGMVANAVVPGITGTEFNVEKIRINPYSGTLRVENLRLANPKGYDAEDAVALGLLSVKVAPFSLFGDTITVRDITLDSPYVSYLDANGTNNFDQIIANVNAGKKEAAPKEEAAKEEGPGKKVIIERLSISGTRVRYGLLTLPIPSFVLTGIGASQGGVTVESVGLEVWEKIKGSFLSAGNAIGNATKLLGDGAANLLGGLTGGDAATSAGEGAKKAAETATEGAKKATEAATEGAKKATETATEGAKKATEAATEGAKKATEAATKAADTVSEGAKKATEALGNLFK